MLKKLSFLFSFAIIFSILISTKSFAFTLPSNNCILTSAGINIYAISLTGNNANSLDGNVPLCVYDAQNGQTISITAQEQGGSVVTLPSVNSGATTTITYSKQFSINDVGTVSNFLQKVVYFKVSDGSALPPSQADYTFNIYAAPITLYLNGTQTTNGATHNINSGSMANLGCTSCTHINVKNSAGTQVLTKNTTTAPWEVNLDMSNLITSVLDDTFFTIEMCNVGGCSSYRIDVKAGPVTVTTQDKTATEGTNATLTWTSDGDSCEVKYSNGDGTYSSFSPVVSGTASPAVNAARSSTSWSAVISTASLDDGVYGYRIECKDTAHNTRSAGSANVSLTLTPNTLTTSLNDINKINGDNTSLNSGSTANLKCANCKSITVKKNGVIVANKSVTVTGSVSLDFSSYISNVLDDTVYTVTASSNSQNINHNITVAARVVSASIAASFTSPSSAAISWTSDGNSCEVLDYTGNVLSPRLYGSSSPNAARSSTTWTATVPVYGVGTYGYKIKCTDTAHPNRGEVTVSTTLTVPTITQTFNGASVTNGSTQSVTSGSQAIAGCGGCNSITLKKNGVLIVTQNADASSNASLDFSSYISNVLDDTVYTVEACNVGVCQRYTVNVKSRPVTVAAVDQYAARGANATIVWQSDGNSCEVKYSSGGGVYTSFSPVVSGTASPAVNAARSSSTSWSATVLTNSLSDGVYGYKIICKDTEHATRLTDEKVITLSISSSPQSSLTLSQTSPNTLNWKCINSTSASMTSSPSDTANNFTNKTTLPLQGSFVHKEGTQYTLTCTGKDTSGNTVDDTSTYNPSSFTGVSRTENGNPKVTLTYTCPAGSVRAELYKGSTLLPPITLTNGAGTYTDYAVANNTTYVYKVYCYDANDNLTAYSQSTVKVGGTLVCPTGKHLSADGSSCVDDTILTPGKNTCAIDGTCTISVQKCLDGSWATTTITTTNSGGVNTNPSATLIGGVNYVSPSVSTITYTYDVDNDNIYQVGWICPNIIPNGSICTPPYQLDKTINMCTYTKIVPAAVPPYAHFVSMNPSASQVQAGTKVSLNYYIQSPNTTCKIDTQLISGGDITTTVSTSTNESLNQSVVALSPSFNSSTSSVITKSTRFTASCTENNNAYSGTPLSGTHKIVREVYVVGEGER